MAATEVALDIQETQVAIDFPDDARFTWHVRVLMSQLSDGGRWVGFSPDLEAEVIDMADHRVVPLVRKAPFPARISGDVYYRTGITDEEFADVLYQCRALAAVLGAPGTATPAPIVADWVYSDAGFEKFGEVVESRLAMTPRTIVVRDHVALINVAIDGGPSWTPAERIQLSDLDLWRDEKLSGPGRDPRVLPLERDANKARYRNLRRLLEDTTYCDPKNPEKDWPFNGPSAFKELTLAVRAAGEELSGFHDYYVRASGLNGEHPVAIKHRDLLAILLHFLSFDQVNGGRLAGTETIARYILQIHQAVRRNPKNPDFRGTSVFTMSGLDSSGGVLTGEFGRYVADEQKAHAFTLKQQRLYADEEEKRKTTGKEDKPDKPQPSGGKK